MISILNIIIIIIITLKWMIQYKIDKLQMKTW